ncbi:hypothetical protein [Microcoleus sp. bin38.metabat.b11b12b14.051]|nr:hypothetical protein [Microcoleus sp. bin38.metabat.b11b12b14.051]
MWRIFLVKLGMERAIANTTTLNLTAIICEVFKPIVLNFVIV